MLLIPGRQKREAIRSPAVALPHALAEQDGVGEPVADVGELPRRCASCPRQPMMVAVPIRRQRPAEKPDVGGVPFPGQDSTFLRGSSAIEFRKHVGVCHVVGKRPLGVVPYRIHDSNHRAWPRLARVITALQHRQRRSRLGLPKSVGDARGVRLVFDWNPCHFRPLRIALMANPALEPCLSDEDSLIIANDCSDHSRDPVAWLERIALGHGRKRFAGRRPPVSRGRTRDRQ